MAVSTALRAAALAVAAGMPVHLAHAQAEGGLDPDRMLEEAMERREQALTEPGDPDDPSNPAAPGSARPSGPDLDNPITPATAERLTAPRGDLIDGVDWLPAARDDLLVAPPTRLAERSVFRGRGVVLRGPGDALVFVPSQRFEDAPPEQDATDEADPASETRPAVPLPAMLLHPCRETELILAGLPADAEGGLFDIAGRVSFYRGRNYIMPLRSGRVSSDPPPADPEPAGPLGGPAGSSPFGQSPLARPATTDEQAGAIDEARPGEGPDTDDVARAANDPAARSLIDELSERMGAARPRPSSQASSGDAARPPSGRPTGTRRLAGEPTEGDPDLAPLPPEGTVLSRRTGHLVRLSGGRWGFALSNDQTNVPPGSAPLSDAGTMFELLPCRLLERIEDIQADRIDPVGLTLSGIVYRSGDSAFLLPTILRINRAGEIAPLQ